MSKLNPLLKEICFKRIDWNLDEVQNSAIRRKVKKKDHDKKYQDTESLLFK